MPFFFDFLQAAARINQPPQAVDFHTCGLRSVISNAHVVGNYDYNYFAPMGAKLCEAFCRVSVCDTCFDKIYVCFLFLLRAY